MSIIFTSRISFAGELDLSAQYWSVAGSGSLSASNLALSTIDKNDTAAYFATIQYYQKNSFFHFTNILLRGTYLLYSSTNDNEKITTDINASNADLFFFPINLSGLEIGGGLKAIQGEFKETYTSLQTTYSYKATIYIPMAYLGFQYNLDTNFKLQAIVLGMKAKKGSYYDYLGQLSYSGFSHSSSPKISLSLGYRQFTLKHKDDELEFDLRFSGPFGGALIAF
ncbi:MAG: hypothetical protein HQK49_00695 [Oligoflexia bacterium]|nr:hypothetical protein [Oligoflexia bacterium]